MAAEQAVLDRFTTSLKSGMGTPILLVGMLAMVEIGDLTKSYGTKSGTKLSFAFDILQIHIRL